MAEPTIQLGGGNWAGKTDNLLGYYKEGERFYKQDFTFSRSTTGTYTDSDGYIQEMPYNLLTYSEDFSNAAWLKTSGVTVTSNYGISPDGKQNSTRLQFASNNEQVYDGIVHSGNTETASIYVKGQSGITMQFGVGSNISQGSTYTLTGEWQRLEHQSTSGSLFIIGNKDLTATDIEIWGAQLVKGTSAKTYFPTTTRLNMPRVDYLNNSNGSLILEPQRTNYCKNSEYKSIYDYNDSVTIEDVDIITPYGITSNAVKINSVQGDNSPIRAAGATALSQQFSQNDVITISGYVKYNEGFRYVQFGGYFGSESARFDLQEGVVIQNLTNVISSSITPFGNDWYRVVVTYTFQDSISNGLLYAGWVMSTNTSFSFTNAPIGSIYVWGVQIELASYATSYIPTSGSSVTRNADACSLTNVADRINSSEGVLFVETSYVNKGYGNSIAITDGTNSQRVQMYFNNNDLSLLLVVKVNDTIVGTHTVSSSGINWDSTNKIAIKYKTNDMSFWLNGTKVAEDTSGTMFSVNTLTKLGFDSGSGGSFYGKCNQIQVYSTALSDSELATLTT